MDSLVPYKAMTILDTTPVGEGGQALNNNFSYIADYFDGLYPILIRHQTVPGAPGSNNGYIYVQGGELYYKDGQNNLVQITNNGSIPAGSSDPLHLVNRASVPSPGAGNGYVYVTAGELYYKDGSNNVIQLTSGGAIPVTNYWSRIGTELSPVTAGDDVKTTGIGTFGTIKIPQIGGTPGKYNIFQGGANTIDLTYTLPIAYPASAAFLKSSNVGILSFDTSTYLTSVTAHNVLSTTHGDTTAAACARGSIIIGDSNSKWVNLVFPSTHTGKILQATATDIEWSTNPLTIGASASVAGSNTGDQTLVGLGGQPQLNGTGFVKATGTTISYDNSTYLTSLSGAVLANGTVPLTADWAIGAYSLTGGVSATFSATGSFASLIATSATGLTLGTDVAGGNPNIAGYIKMFSAGDNAFYSTFTAGTQSANANYTFPLARPTANSQALLGTNADPSVLSWGTNFGANDITTTGNGKFGEMILTRSGSITRDVDNYIATVVKTGGRTLTVTRASGYITSITDGTLTWTFTRNVDNEITAWSVT
jgi:hypothetical protein